MAAPRMPHLVEVAANAAAVRRSLSIAIHSSTEVAELIDHLDDPTRAKPVVIVSPRNSSQLLGVSPRKLAEELDGHARVYALATAALTWELDSRPEYRTYGGAVRVVGRGSGEVLRTDGEPDVVLDRIVASTIAEAARMASAPRPAAARAAAPADVPTPLDLMRRRTPLKPPAAATAAVTVTVVTPAAADFAAVKGALSHARETVALIEAELDAERTARTESDHRAAVAARELAAARAEIDRLREELDRTSAPLFSDPEEQFRDDVQRTWLRTVAETDRRSYPLRPFRLGPAFLASLDLPQAPRTKIVEVVVDVLTRRAYEMASRAVRPHGAGGPAGVAGQIVRSDGATGYRANIRTNTPQAPRLMWWELTDGTVELALAGRHDDAMPA